MKQYFVYDSYVASGRPKAETAVMNYAEGNFMYSLISEDKLDDVVADIRKYCAMILEENKRYAPVDIRLSDEQYEWHGHRTLHIGQQSLRLRKVKIVI